MGSLSQTAADQRSSYISGRSSVRVCTTSRRARDSSLKYSRARARVGRQRWISATLDWPETRSDSMQTTKEAVRSGLLLGRNQKLAALAQRLLVGRHRAFRLLSLWFLGFPVTFLLPFRHRFLPLAVYLVAGSRRRHGGRSAPPGIPDQSRGQSKGPRP